MVGYLVILLPSFLQSIYTYQRHQGLAYLTGYFGWKWIQFRFFGHEESCTGPESSILAWTVTSNKCFPCFQLPAFSYSENRWSRASWWVFSSLWLTHPAGICLISFWAGFSLKCSENHSHDTSLCICNMFLFSIQWEFRKVCQNYLKQGKHQDKRF